MLSESTSNQKKKTGASVLNRKWGHKEEENITKIKGASCIA